MEKDYKKLYLEQKQLALTLEMQLMNMRARMIENERVGLNEELEAYADKSKDPGKEET